MPYIVPEERHDQIGSGNMPGATRETIGLMVGQTMRNGGDLQYIIAVAFQEFFEIHGLTYARGEMLKGSLLGAIDEMHDKVVFPYERVKEEENGGVYDFAKLMRLKDEGKY